ncbi:MAG: hypothetical protein H7A46_11600 [Verrucomicrobiales bacterium]|nr:hypothetical protein [Verrucomicrobiales bacterium]
MSRKSRQKKNPVVLALRSGPVLCAVAGLVLLGASSLGKVWHENRNVLLQGEIRQLDHQLARLRLSLVDLRVQEAQALSPAGIQRRLTELGLDLSPPAEAQIKRLVEPDWPARLASPKATANPVPSTPPPSSSGATLATSSGLVPVRRHSPPGEALP